MHDFFQFHQYNLKKTPTDIMPLLYKTQHEFSNFFGVKIKTLNISNTETLICRKKQIIFKNTVNKMVCNSIYCHMRNKKMQKMLPLASKNLFFIKTA